MPTKKLLDLPSWPTGQLPSIEGCRHPEHDPPRHRVFSNGLYEHECPGCKAKTPFLVNKPTL